jgi:hypothetical protein
MSKFSSQDDAGYQLVVHKIKQWVTEGLSEDQPLSTLGNSVDSRNRTKASAFQEVASLPRQNGSQSDVFSYSPNPATFAHRSRDLNPSFANMGAYSFGEQSSRRTPEASRHPRQSQNLNMQYFDNNEVIENGEQEFGNIRGDHGYINQSFTGNKASGNGKQSFGNWQR